ncbi:MAG: YkgJ family cysteine cluster protein [Thermoplasmatota archaeon]
MERHARADEERIIEEEWAELHGGIRWRCIRCMKCCKSSWAVNLTWFEFERSGQDPRASDLDIHKVEVDPDTGLSHPYFVIGNKCRLLDESTRSCRLYPDWFYTCATYPFLLMPDGTLRVHEKCSGIGHGDLMTLHDIREMILKERQRAKMVLPGKRK